MQTITKRDKIILASHIGLFTVLYFLADFYLRMHVWIFGFGLCYVGVSCLVFVTLDVSSYVPKTLKLYIVLNGVAMFVFGILFVLRSL